MSRVEYRGDFHTHTIASDDGGLYPEHIAAVLEAGILDIVGVTDHDTIGPETFELAAQYPGQVIVGEEVTTLDYVDGKAEESEIIGLFLVKSIKKHMPTIDTAWAIREQGGLIYAPHPRDRRRKGMSIPMLDAVHRDAGIDVAERFNSRSFHQHHAHIAIAWALKNNVVMASGSDAHGPDGWGKTYNILEELPTRETFVRALQLADYMDVGATLRARWYPSQNRRMHKQAREQALVPV